MANASSDAAHAATGRGLEEWRALLDDAGARDRDHKGIVALLVDEGVESGWWRQQLTVDYEQWIGRRIPGQTQGTDFQVGVSRTVPVAQDALWERLVGELLARWLEGAAALPREVGERVDTDGGSAQLRSIDPPSRLRLRLDDPDGTRRSTMQLTLTKAKTGTTMGFHEEQLPSQEQRGARRAHWRSVASGIADELGQGA